MKHRLLLFLSLMMFASATDAGAQTFTDHLKKRVAGSGTVVIVQDAEIERLVNDSLATLPVKKGDANDGDERLARGPRHKVQGFRVQVYTGGNSREARNEAARMESRVRAAFPELSVYKTFVSPRWICRVGDFREQEEAARYAELIRKAGVSSEARVVKCVVLVR